MTRETAIQKVMDELMINNICLIFNPHIFGSYLEQLIGVGIDIGIRLQGHGKKIIETDKNGNQIGPEYQSAVEAGRINGIVPSSITRVCRGVKRTTHGRYWKQINN